ncbi:MAG: NAD(P)H-dependent glycerol-3-phosphate dehydrogenase [Bacilli bacterium]|nr:NAD(P)H-dependent glycerol-3-phosphate dehydrogenase [Bacilli bacterium]
MNKVTVIGCGRWGSFIAYYLDLIGKSVTLYGRSTSKDYIRFKETRSNGKVVLKDTLELTCDLDKALSNDIIVISINSQGLRALMKEIKDKGVTNKTYILCMKGIEIDTGKRLSEVVDEFKDEFSNVAVWIGPGHVEEFVKGVPNCMVIDSLNNDTKEMLVKEFSSNLIRFYYGSDMIGNEIGAASKNVIGIAAGMLDGFGLSSLKGALMSRGTIEISRFIKAMGGNELSAYGLCHLGDYEATVFSEHSHNRKFGETFVKGEEYSSLAEGYYTVKAMVNIAREKNIELPICETVYNILYNKKDPKEELDKLFMRSIKKEFIF